MEVHSEAKRFQSERERVSRFRGEWPGVALVVDDDIAVRRSLARELRRRGWICEEAGDVEEASLAIAGASISIVVADQDLPGTTGIEFLAGLRAENPEIQRVLMTAAPEAPLMRDAINRGAISFFLSKPWTHEDLDQMEGAAVGPTTDRRAAPSDTQRPGQIPEIVGESAAIRELVTLIQNVADTESTVLVTGETGTGKELVGRAIHQMSRRRDRILCAVNSAAFPETLLESELFGHRKGAFTGAAANTKGLFEQADGGTVFLDEVAEMPLPMQAKLLRFLQTGEVRPVGGEATRIVDVRLVAATNKDLEEEVAAGRFREDLYYRLAVIPLRVPPLRERLDDISILADHFLARMCEKSGRSLRGIDPEARQLLLAYRWPGNVRELENAIERGVALARTPFLQVTDLPKRLRAPESQREVPDAIQSLPGLERQHILRTLERVGWNRKRAAELLQISTTTLWRRLKEFGVEAPRGNEIVRDDSILRG